MKNYDKLLLESSSKILNEFKFTSVFVKNKNDEDLNTHIRGCSKEREIINIKHEKKLNLCDTLAKAKINGDNFPSNGILLCRTATHIKDYNDKINLWNKCHKGLSNSDARKRGVTDSLKNLAQWKKEQEFDLNEILKSAKDEIRENNNPNFTKFVNDSIKIALTIGNK